MKLTLLTALLLAPLAAHCAEEPCSITDRTIIFPKQVGTGCELLNYNCADFAPIRIDRLRIEP